MQKKEDNIYKSNRKEIDAIYVEGSKNTAAITATTPTRRMTIQVSQKESLEEF